VCSDAIDHLRQGYLGRKADLKVLQSIYAFVQSRPTPPPITDIPLLAP
jgi:hypothetical protein